MFHATLFIISQKYFVWFFKVRTQPSMHNFGLEASPGNAISEGRRQASPLQHELGSGSSRYGRNVSRMSRTENILSQKFFEVVLKTILSTFYATLFIISRKYSFCFQSPHPPLDTQFWTFCHAGLSIKAQ